MSYVKYVLPWGSSSLECLLTSSGYLELLKCCGYNFSQTILRGHATDGKTQFLQPASSYWLVVLGAN